MNDELDTSPRAFWIMAGGPWNAIARQLRLRGPRGDGVWRLVAITWLPLVLAALLRALAGAPANPLFLDLSVHVRFLLALPLLAVAARIFDLACQATVLQLYGGAFADRAALDAVFDRAEQLRDAWWAEAALAAIALGGGQLTLWGATGPTGVFHGIESTTWTVGRVWYAAFAVPLVNFLAVRWLWRWAIWTVILARIARRPLATTATHPDRAAGLGFLAGPVTAFAVFELAFASVLAGAWGTQLLDHRVTVPSLLPTLITFVVAALVIACAPLLPFSLHLFRAQRRALLAYGPFALDYVRRFHRKWIDGRSDEPVLGSPDIQSLADLDNSFQIAATTGMFVFGKRKLVELWLAAIVPMLPLVAAVVPVDQLLKRIGSTMFAGLL